MKNGETRQLIPIYIGHARSPYGKVKVGVPNLRYVAQASNVMAERLSWESAEVPDADVRIYTVKMTKPNRLGYDSFDVVVKELSRMIVAC